MTELTPNASGLGDSGAALAGGVAGDAAFTAATTGAAGIAGRSPPDIGLDDADDAGCDAGWRAAESKSRVAISASIRSILLDRSLPFAGADGLAGFAAGLTPFLLNLGKTTMTDALACKYANGAGIAADLIPAPCVANLPYFNASPPSAMASAAFQAQIVALSECR